MASVAPESLPPAYRQLFRQAAAYKVRRQFKEAEAVYCAIVAHASREPQSRAGVGMEMVRQRRFGDAVLLLEAAPKNASRSAEFHNALGFALTGTGRLDAAVRHYKLALKRKSGFAEAHNNLAYTLQQLQRYPEALEHCDKALALRPAYPEAHNNRGNALQALARSADALAAYSHALSFNPAFSEARRNLAVGLVGLGYVGDAVTNLAVPASLLADVSTLVMIGQLYLHADNGRSALRIYERAQQLDQSNERVVYGLGRACILLHRFEEAARLFESMIERGVRSGEVLSQLAGLPPSTLRIDLLGEFDKMSGQVDDTKGRLLDFSRGVLFDRTRRYGEAWAVIEKANAELWKSLEPQRRVEEAREAEALTQLRSWPVHAAIDASSRCSTLFILGASRSGKTTAETLASHLDGVDRGYENSLIDDCWRLTLNRHGLADDGRHDHLPEAARACFRDTYRAAVTRAAGAGTIFTTTNPGLIQSSAFLAETLPGVRFLLIKRNVEDTVLRMLMKSYRHGHAYAYDIDAARAHVVWYHQMIDEVARMLPDISRVMSYEDMLASPGASVNAIAELCRLPVRAETTPPLHDDRDCARPYSSFLN